MAWTPEAVHEEVLALSAPRWILVKNLPPFLWRFLPQLLENLGKIIRMDEIVRLVPHMDARVLILLLLGKEIPSEININVLNEDFVCPIEILGGLNACFLCRKEGHRRRDCPILNKPSVKSSNNNNPPPKSTLPINPLVSSKSDGQPAMKAPISSNFNQIVSALNLNSSPPPEAMLGPKLDDGFTPVRNKKKRRGITSINPISNFINSNSPPILNPLLSVVLFEHPASSKPTLNPSKAPPKVFKEIDDGYTF